MISYKELLYKNQLDLIEIEQKESVFGYTVPIYQNPDIQRPSSDPYRILQDYRSPDIYRKTILVIFDKLPEGLRGSTNGQTRMDVDTDETYESYDVMGHEATHILHLDWPEDMVRMYSPKGIRSFEEFGRHFPQLNFVIGRRR